MRGEGLAGGLTDCIPLSDCTDYNALLTTDMVLLCIFLTFIGRFINRLLYALALSLNISKYLHGLSWLIFL